MSQQAEQVHLLLDQILSQEASKPTTTALLVPRYQQALNNVEEELKHRLSLSMAGNNNIPTLLITTHRHPKTNRRRRNSMMQMNIRRRRMKR